MTHVLKKSPEYKQFVDLLDRCLRRRGLERNNYVRQLQDFFIQVWEDAQTLHLDQYKELMADKRKLRNQMRELTEEHDEELTRLEKEIDSLREKLVARKQT